MNANTQPMPRRYTTALIVWIAIKVLLIALLAHQDVAGFLYAGF